jgi:hypothetical protein
MVWSFQRQGISKKGIEVMENESKEKAKEISI